MHINQAYFSASYGLNLSYFLARMKPKNMFYWYTTKYILQEIPLKESILNLLFL